MRYDKLDEGFIGSFYGKHNQIEVLAFDHYRRGKKDRVYKVKCLLCANDSELFGSGEFKTPRSMILRNIEPCGCSSATRYTEDQQRILVSRSCSKSNYQFLVLLGILVECLLN